MFPEMKYLVVGRDLSDSMLSKHPRSNQLVALQTLEIVFSTPGNDGTLGFVTLYHRWQSIAHQNISPAIPGAFVMHLVRMCSDRLSVIKLPRRRPAGPQKTPSLDK